MIVFCLYSMIYVQQIICGAHSIFDECGSACVATCDQKVIVPCSLQCVPRCVCESGYIWNSNMNLCVEENSC